MTIPTIVLSITLSLSGSVDERKATEMCELFGLAADSWRTQSNNWTEHKAESEIVCKKQKN